MLSWNDELRNLNLRFEAKSSVVEVYKPFAVIWLSSINHQHPPGTFNQCPSDLLATTPFKVYSVLYSPVGCLACYMPDLRASRTRHLQDHQLASSGTPLHRYLGYLTLWLNAFTVLEARLCWSVSSLLSVSEYRSTHWFDKRSDTELYGMFQLFCVGRYTDNHSTDGI